MVIASIANAPTAAAANSSTAMLPRGLPRDPDDSRPPVPTPLRAGPVHRQPFRQGSTQHHHDPVPAVDCHTSVPGAACRAADRRHPRKPCRLSPPLSQSPFRAMPIERDGGQQKGTEAIYLAARPDQFAPSPLVAISRRPLRRRNRMFGLRLEEHTCELQALMRTSYAVFGLEKKE